MTYVNKITDIVHLLIHLVLDASIVNKTPQKHINMQLNPRVSGIKPQTLNLR